MYVCFWSFIQKKGGFGGPKIFHNEFLAVVGHFGHENGWFLKARTLFKTIFFLNRSHDGSAHTFGSSQRFLEMPQKEV